MEIMMGRDESEGAGIRGVVIGWNGSMYCGSVGLGYTWDMLSADIGIYI